LKVKEFQVGFHIKSAFKSFELIVVSKALQRYWG